MAEEPAEQTEHAKLKSSRNASASMAVFALVAAGAAGYAFNLSPLGKPDLSEKNVAYHTEQAVRGQVRNQFNATSDVVERSAVKNLPDIPPGEDMVFALQGARIIVDPVKAHNDAVASIKSESDQERKQGNVPAAALALLGLVIAGKAVRETRRLSTLAPQA